MSDLIPPGKFLFVGGGLDGRRLYVADPRPELQVGEPISFSLGALVAGDEIPNVAMTRHVYTYRLEILQAPGLDAYVYLHNQISSRELLSVLITGYRSGAPR